MNKSEKDGTNIQVGNYKNVLKETNEHLNNGEKFMGRKSQFKKLSILGVCGWMDTGGKKQWSESLLACREEQQCWNHLHVISRMYQFMSCCLIRIARSGSRGMRKS